LRGGKGKPCKSLVRHGDATTGARRERNEKNIEPAVIDGIDPKEDPHPLSLGSKGDERYPRMTRECESLGVWRLKSGGKGTGGGEKGKPSIVRKSKAWRSRIRGEGREGKLINSGVHFEISVGVEKGESEPKDWESYWAFGRASCASRWGEKRVSPGEKITQTL